MGYTVRKNGDRYEIVSPKGEVVGSRATEEAAEDRADVLDSKALLTDLSDRVPRTEMTAEEKAAEYDRIVAERQKDDKSDSGAGSSGAPPGPDPKPVSPAGDAGAGTGSNAKTKNKGFFGSAYQ